MNLSERLKIHVSPDIGNVSGLLILPENPKALLVLSHGAGAGMEHSFMEALSRKLTEYGVGTLRFNFPYMEKGGGPPDRPNKAHPTILAAVAKALEFSKGLTLLSGGKSFGGRMTSQVAAEEKLGKVKGIVYYGFPLHAPGKQGTERAAHLEHIEIPQLFLQGTRDKLAETGLIKDVCKNLPTARLVFLEGADHSFKMLKSAGITLEENIERLAKETAEFAQSL